MGTFIIYDKVINNDTNENNTSVNLNDDNSFTSDNNLVNLIQDSEVDSILLSKYIIGNHDPIEKSVSIIEKDKKNKILLMLENLEFIDKVPEGIGFEFPTQIVVKKTDSSIITIILSGYNDNKIIVHDSKNSEFNRYRVTKGDIKTVFDEFFIVD